MKHAATSPVSFIAHVARLPKKGMPVVIDADEKQRAALAREHGLEAVSRYHADMIVAAWKNGGVRVSGTVEAEITQACVMTLEPIESKIAEKVTAVFLPEESKLLRLDFHTANEIVLNADGPDGPEVFSGDTIDVGALAEEFFALAIDPYPRKKGVSAPETPENDVSDEKRGELFEKLKSFTPKS
ncbi:MAG TPA: DUF177 domain-containing protein [Rhizobiaceae bacterium]|nr:DUF177 domain-containing protein [Rhizobiaceae bacterium]